jgi:hypothetical protein
MHGDCESQRDFDVDDLAGWLAALPVVGVGVLQVLERKILDQHRHSGRVLPRLPLSDQVVVAITTFGSSGTHLGSDRARRCVRGPAQRGDEANKRAVSSVEACGTLSEESGTSPLFAPRCLRQVIASCDSANVCD